MKHLSVLAGVSILLCAPAIAQQRWIGSWGASPQPPIPENGTPLQTLTFTDQTIRQIVRLSAGGDRVRLRLSNEYGTRPLQIGAVTIALARTDGTLRTRSLQEVTFAGQTSAVIAAGAPLFSDPVDLEVDELETLAISMYLPGETGACTCHQTGFQTALVSGPGDYTNDAFEPEQMIQARAYLSGVEVYTNDAAGVVVTLGDSITDGFGSGVDANNRWPDILARRLAARRGPSFGVVNQGISGNRVLSDGIGESALARFDRDVLSVAGVTHVVVLEGINDVGVAFGSFGEAEADFAIVMPRTGEVRAQMLIAGYRQLIARAHSQGLRIYGATITPFLGATYYSEEGESVRQAVNSWIRTGDEFDGVIDFDSAVRDAEQPLQIADGLHSGDYLHGSDAGYTAMGESIDLTLFQ